MISRLAGEIKKKKLFIFSSYCPLKILPLKTCNPDISKIIMAGSFKFDQQIQDGEIILIDKLIVANKLSYLMVTRHIR